jgi:hypothetical protein
MLEPVLVQKLCTILRALFMDAKKTSIESIFSTTSISKMEFPKRMSLNKVSQNGMEHMEITIFSISLFAHTKPARHLNSTKGQSFEKLWLDLLHV